MRAPVPSSSWWKLMSRLRVAETSFTGTLTRPKLMAPLQTVLGTAPPAGSGDPVDGWTAPGVGTHRGHRGRRGDRRWAIGPGGRHRTTRPRSATQLTRLRGVRRRPREQRVGIPRGHDLVGLATALDHPVAPPPLPREL